MYPPFLNCIGSVICAHYNKFIQFYTCSSSSTVHFPSIFPRLQNLLQRKWEPPENRRESFSATLSHIPRFSPSRVIGWCRVSGFALSFLPSTTEEERRDSLFVAYCERVEQSFENRSRSLLDWNCSSSGRRLQKCGFSCVNVFVCSMIAHKTDSFRFVSALNIDFVVWKNHTNTLNYLMILLDRVRSADVTRCFLIFFHCFIIHENQKK